jgi:DNA polymerase III alpha subunit
VPSNKFWSEGATGRNKVVAGFVKKATKRNSARGSFLVLSLDFDSEIIPITIWGDYYEGKEDEFKGIEEKLLIISGELKFDKFNGKNCLFVNSKDKHIIL